MREKTKRKALKAKKLRENTDMTMEEIGNEMDVAHGTVSRWLKKLEKETPREEIKEKSENIEIEKDEKSVEQDKSDKSKNEPPTKNFIKKYRTEIILAILLLIGVYVIISSL